MILYFPLFLGGVSPHQGPRYHFVTTNGRQHVNGCLHEKSIVLANVKPYEYKSKRRNIYIYISHNCIDSTQNIFQKNIFTKRGNISRAWRSSTLRSLSLSSSVPSLNNFGQGYHLSLTRQNVTNLNSLNSWPISCPTRVILENSWGFQISSSFSRKIYTSPLDTITRPDITG